MLGIIFDVLFLSLIRKMPKGSTTPQSRNNDVFIPFEDRVGGNTRQATGSEEKLDYSPQDFDEFGDFD